MANLRSYIFCYLAVFMFGKLLCLEITRDFSTIKK